MVPFSIRTCTISYYVLTPLRNNVSGIQYRYKMHRIFIIFLQVNSLNNCCTISEQWNDWIRYLKVIWHKKIQCNSFTRYDLNRTQLQSSTSSICVTTREYLWRCTQFLLLLSERTRTFYTHLRSRLDFIFSGWSDLICTFCEDLDGVYWLENNGHF